MATVLLIRNYGNTRNLPYRNKQYFVPHDGVIETTNKSLAKTFSRLPSIGVSERPLAKGESPEIDEASKLNSVIPEVRDSIDFNKLRWPTLRRLAREYGIVISRKTIKADLIAKLKEYKKCSATTSPH